MFDDESDTIEYGNEPPEVYPRLVAQIGFPIELY